MRSVMLVALLGACQPGEPDLVITVAAPITQTLGSAPSGLDPIIGHTIGIELEWQSISVLHVPDPSAGCMTSEFAMGNPTRTASGDTAAVVQTELLDFLGNWRVRLQLCSQAADTIRVADDGDLSHLQAWFACTIPAAAEVPDAEGYPVLTSFTTSGCETTIHDIPNDRVYLSDSHAMTITTGRKYLGD